MSHVALVYGEDRKENIKRVLQILEKDISSRIKKAKKIVIKPNLVTAYNFSAVTSVDAARAVLEYVTKLAEGEVYIAEGTAEGTTSSAFKNYGYYQLAEEFSLQLVDIDQTSFKWIAFSDGFKVKVSDLILQSDFRISLALPKTHDTVIVTLGLKNILVGSLVGLSSKQSIHRGYKKINQYLYELAEIIPPHLTIIDGFIGMEGNGPTNGSLLHLGMALGSCDFVAADTVMAHIMGFKISEIGYLYYAWKNGLGEGDLSKIKILGSAIKERKPFKPHRTYQAQLMWRK
jgi:uncharacterized protein (DUF362 family)